uniref:Uncharacterized protein n=1 Tax=Candidozyma auris TaxID=498019 RepID=A0A0L0NY47_CANAR
MGKPSQWRLKNTDSTKAAPTETAKHTDIKSHSLPLPVTHVEKKKVRGHRGLYLMVIAVAAVFTWYQRR